MKTWACLAGAALAGLFAGTAAGLSPAGAQPVNTTLFKFPVVGTQKLGIMPGPVIADGADLVGVTLQGGHRASFCGSAGCGTIYRLVPPPPTSSVWTHEILYTFKALDDGMAEPVTPAVDSQGNIYGVARLLPGRADNNVVVWKLSPPVAPATTWTYRILQTLNGTDIAGREGTGIQHLVVDDSGVIYLSASFEKAIGPGTPVAAILTLTPSGGKYVAAVLHYFNKDLSYAYIPAFTVLHGTEIIGTAYSIYNTNVVFALHLIGGVWEYHQLYAAAAGEWPGLLVADDKLDLIVTAASGGASGTGEVFELSPPATGQTAWTEHTLYDFPAAAAGKHSSLTAGVAQDRRTGALFGAFAGATPLAAADGSTGNAGGTFRLDPPASGSGAWTPTILHAFGSPTAADYIPNTQGLAFGRSGLLYGSTTLGGPANGGVIFRQTPE